MKRKKYILWIMTAFLLIIFLTAPIISNADISINPGDYEPTGVTGANQFVDKANIIIGVIQAVGSIVAVIVLIIIGLRYMMAGVDEKADYKSTMVPYVIGCAMLFIVSNLVEFIYDLVQNNVN